MFVPSRGPLIEALTEASSPEIADLIVEGLQEAVCLEHRWSPKRLALSVEGPTLDMDCWAEGAPIVPAGFEWPRTDHTDKPLQFLLQVNLAALPDVPSWPNQPTSGWLLFFGEPSDHYEGTEGFHDTVTGAVRLIPAEVPMVVPEPQRCTSLAVGELGWSPPSWHDPLFAAVDIGDSGSAYPREAMKAGGEMTSYPPMQFMGYPEMVQWPPFSDVPEAGEYRLLAMHCVSDFVDYFGISEADLAAQRFDRAIHEAQS